MKSIIFIFILCVSYSTQELDLSSIAKSAALMMGYTIDHMFNSDKNYPPIEEDATFFTTINAPLDHQFLLNDPSTFDVIASSKKVCFVIHGWTDSAFGGAFSPHDLWMQEIVDEWTKHSDCTVIAVDWKRLANYDYITSATKNTKLVGAYLTKFISYISETFGIPLSDITIAGHSLGAQISGYAGAALNGGIGLIIGLDPAGPLFDMPFKADNSECLDKSDAQFVQVFHTSCGLLGVEDQVGHADYFINGGKYQPLCFGGGLLGITEDNPEAIVCGHIRSYEYLLASFDPNNKFVAQKCTISASCELIQLVRGRCSAVDLIGIHSNLVPGKFYVDTTGKPPYV